MHSTPTLGDLLARLTPETLVQAYLDVTDVDDIFTEDLADEILIYLSAIVGEQNARDRLGLVASQETS